MSTSITITLRQAEELLLFFGGDDCDVSISEYGKGLLAYCTDYPEEGGQYLGDTVVAESADSGRDKARERAFHFKAHLNRQRAFSERTFGPGARTNGVIDHIRKELLEIEAAPADLSEWIDVVILALDGAWRTGATPEQIIAALVAKQDKNEARQWPDWRTAAPDQAIEHVRHDPESIETSEQEAR